MKHRVSELEGALLDAAVAKCEGRELVDVAGKRAAVSFEGAIARTLLAWAPSTNWSHGGPIIERERMLVAPDEENAVGVWSACVQGYVCEGDDTSTIAGGRSWQSGPTPLIAAMRAFVASKFGDEVELP